MTDIRIEVDLGHPAERVWRALTDRRVLAHWFMETDLEPHEGSRFQLNPGDLAGFGYPIEGELTELAAPRRMVMLWQGDQLHSQVVWELENTPSGCRLRMTQSGFLGVSGSARRRALRRTYQDLFMVRLPDLLDRLATGEVDLGGAPLPLRTALPRSRRGRAAAARTTAPDGPDAPQPAAAWRDAPRPAAWRRVSELARWPLERRGQVLAVAASAILVALIASVFVSLSPPDSSDPAAAAPDRWARPPAAGVQPGVTSAVSAGGFATDSVRPAGQASSGAIPPPIGGGGPATPAATASAPAPGGAPSNSAAGPPELGAEYRTVDSWLLGYQGEVAVGNSGGGSADAWVVTITLPALAVVTTSWEADFGQQGTTVIFTPKSWNRTVAPGGSVRFGFEVALNATLLGPKAPLSCTIDGASCTGIPG